MTRRKPTSPLRAARDRKGYGREWVGAQLDPPVTSKTIERWEVHPEKVKGYRLEQLAELYGSTREEMAA